VFTSAILVIVVEIHLASINGLPVGAYVKKARFSGSAKLQKLQVYTEKLIITTKVRRKCNEGTEHVPAGVASQ
jgi:hypothetical protein